MNINGISNDSGSAISSLLALKNNNSSAVSGDTNTNSASSSSAASSTVSKPGELMAKLSQLQQQDPAKFKQVAQQISDDLKSQAGSASGPQAQFLTKLSDNFAQAASSGSLASLQPPAGEHNGAAGAHHHHGGHHAGGTGGAGGPGGGIEAVLSKALDEVNQALSSSTTSSTGSTSSA